jgi:hypothetical protein
MLRPKATNIKVTTKFLNDRAGIAIERGFAKQKWVLFCEALISEGFALYLYEARATWSKYITVKKGERAFRVRFSNHKPTARKERLRDCDFYVGITNTGTRTTDDALAAVRAHFSQAAQTQTANP